MKWDATAASAQPQVGGMTKYSMNIDLDLGPVRSEDEASSELATHLAAYRVRKDIKVVVHGHPPTAIALVTTGVAIPPFDA